MTEKSPPKRLTLRTRLELFLFGAFIVVYAWTKMDQGKFAWQNPESQPVFAPGAMVVGAVIALMAFLPPASLVDRWTGPKKSRRISR